MNEALAFVQDLAEKVVGHDVPLSETEKSAINTIQAYVKQMLKDIKKQRGQDQNEVNRYRAVVQGCADEAKNALDGAVNNLRTGSDRARDTHVKCREDEVAQSTETSEECSKYDSYRSTRPGNEPPKCMETLTTSDVKTSDATTKKNMEECITSINMWVVPLYDLYMKCKGHKDTHLDDTKKCDEKQSEFEGAFCQYSTLLAATCKTQKSCRKKNIKILEDGDADVKIAEEARQADCEAVTPTCPDKITYPPTPGPTPCDKEASEPCERAWLETEYESQKWFAQAPTTACQPCHP